MPQSQYHLTFQSAGNELVQIWGRAFVLKDFLKKTQEQIENDITLNKIPETFMSTGLPYRDLTKVFEQGKPNLLTVHSQYYLTHSNLQGEINIIISRECMFYIAQAYEVLESYLYDQISEFLYAGNGADIFVDKNHQVTKQSIRKGLKTLDDRNNNRHLIRILRAHSHLFRATEASNFRNLNLYEWFEMLGYVRQCITHQRTVVSDDLVKKLPNIYKNYFTITPYDGVHLLIVSYEKCSELIIGVVEFMHLVSKSLIETNNKQ